MEPLDCVTEDNSPATGWAQSQVLSPVGRCKSLFYPESRLIGFTSVDGTMAFYLRVNALLAPSAVMLDVGCGRGARAGDRVRIRRELATFKGRCRKVIGIDLDFHARGNPTVDEFRLIEGARWPVDDASVDVAIADWVLEHVEYPDVFFAECRRVLRPGGFLHVRTPNLLSYFGFFSALIPDPRHATVLRRLQPGRTDEDVFPKYYRCNTVGRLQRILDRHGFRHLVQGYEPEPDYLAFSRIAYLLGVLHQRLAPNRLRTNLFAHASKNRDEDVETPRLELATGGPNPD